MLPQLGIAKLSKLMKERNTETARLKAVIEEQRRLQQSEHSDLKEEYRQIARHMGLVTRLVQQGSYETKSGF